MTWERFTCETDCAAFPETCISERLIRTMADAMEAEGFRPRLVLGSPLNFKITLPADLHMARRLLLAFDSRSLR